jgi:CheY-like chemotaxis protein
MDKVLIIGNNREFVDTLKAGLDKVRLFEVLVAVDDLQAVEILFSEKISVTVIDISITHGMDCFEAIAYMSRAHASIPLVLITGDQKPWYHERKSKNEGVYHLHKPFDIGGLASAIHVGLELKDSPANSSGMTVSRLLPLIEMHRKTCRMEVKTKGKVRGYFYFNDGVLVDAHLEGFSSEEAALQMSRWKGITVNFSDLPGRRIRHRVTTPLMDLAGAKWTHKPPASPPGATETTASSPPVEPEDKTAPQQQEKLQARAANFEKILHRHLDEAQNVQGIVGLAVHDAKGDLMAKEIIDPSSNLARLLTDTGKLLHRLSVWVEECQAGETRELTLETSVGTANVMSTSGLSENTCLLTGLITTEGDHLAMSSLLQALFEDLKESPHSEDG